MQIDSDSFQNAFLDDLVCLHPTDTVLGITANPCSKVALTRLAKLKSRKLEEQSFVHITSSFEKAMTCWEPLPQSWHRFLKESWPPRLTVIWSHKLSSKLSNEVNLKFLSLPKDGGIAIRKIKTNCEWFNSFLNQFPYPIPSTSANTRGESPINDIDEARAFLAQKDFCYIPELSFQEYQQSKQTIASTIVKIYANSSFEILRQGPINKEQIDEKLSSFSKS